MKGLMRGLDENYRKNPRGYLSRSNLSGSPPWGYSMGTSLRKAPPRVPARPREGTMGHPRGVSSGATLVAYQFCTSHGIPLWCPGWLP